jgi:NAD(P)-dependent dehydrogenase (short-subunit alcohol dehydrogenase family)
VPADEATPAPPATPDYPGLLRLDGRVFLVVGAGQGIGLQAAHALSSVGARVVCIDNEQERAEQAAELVGGVPAVGDARERADVERIVAEAGKECGPLYGLVDIVGMARYGQLVDVSDEDYDWTFGMVLRHAFLFSQAMARHLAAHGTRGAMVFVASVSGLTGAPGHAVYGAAKAALMSMVRSLAVELGPSGTRVNAVAPGPSWTPRVSVALGDEGRARNEANAPLRRIADPSDIASCILFLASDLARHVTGQILVADGGVSAKFPYPITGQ